MVKLNIWLIKYAAPIDILKKCAEICSLPTRKKHLVLKDKKEN